MSILDDIFGLCKASWNSVTDLSIQIYMTGIAMLEEYVNSLTSVKFTFNNKHDNMQWFDKDFLNSWI